MLRCHRIGQALCALSHQRAQETIVANDGRPLLYVYLCDGWSAKVRGDIKKECGQHVVKRQGHFRHEFLLERPLVKCRRADGHEELHMLFGPPRGLRLGKSSWNVLTAACRCPSTYRTAHCFRHHCGSCALGIRCTTIPCGRWASPATHWRRPETW